MASSRLRSRGERLGDFRRRGSSARRPEALLGAPAARESRRTLRDVRGGHRRRAFARRQRRQAKSHVHLPRLLPVVHAGGRQLGQLPGGSGPIHLRPRVPDRPVAMGAASDTCGHGLFLPQLFSRQDGRLLPQPRRSDRIAPVHRGVGPDRCRQPGAGNDSARCRSALGTKGKRAHRLLRRPYGCMLRARWPDSDALEGLRGGQGGVEGDRRLLLQAP